MIQHLEILIDCLFLHSKMLMTILQEILVINITSLVEITDFNALIDNKPFFDQPKKNKTRTV